MGSSVLNFNIGILGHVDSGKTSLAKALSNIASTAAFDKNPQSKARGITIDLGFSSFSVPFPNYLRTEGNMYETLQFTLVDCPGHASLIKTIIGGAQIIDLMLLVVDVTKGIQTQTAECLVIGEITCEHMVIALNKIDLLPEETRQSNIIKMSKKINKTLKKTKFLNSLIIPVSAGNSLAVKSELIGIENLIDTLKKLSYVPHRSPKGPFVFAVDHCFSIKGQGSIMTGTVIQGSISISDYIEIPTVNMSAKKIKSIQMFKKPVETAIQGDRIGICVTQFDSKLLERGIAGTPGHMKYVDAVIASIDKVDYFKGSCYTKSKFHITILHDTVLAKCSFFGSLHTNNVNELNNSTDFNFSAEYIYIQALFGNLEKQFVGFDNLPSKQYALIEFEHPVIVSEDALLIGSRLDSDINTNACRLAFYGRIATAFLNKQVLGQELPNLKVFKMKYKEGYVERMVNDQEIICSEIFKKENLDIFMNFKVFLSTGELGIIMGSFGKSGKIRVFIPNGLSSRTKELIAIQKTKTNLCASFKNVKIVLSFKRYIYDKQNKISQ